MYINPDSDLTLKLKLTDRRDEPIRADRLETLTVSVFTDDRENALRFGKSDIESDDDADRLFISSDELRLLGPGVIAYEYRYTTKSDPRYDKVKTVYTNFYYRAAETPDDEDPMFGYWVAVDRMRGNIDRLYDRHDADVNDIRDEIDTKWAGFATREEVEAVADERYTKTEVDGLISGFASGFDDMKSEVDAKLSEVDGKVDGALSTIDSRFDGLKSELTENYYDKTEIDGRLTTLESKHDEDIDSLNENMTSLSGTVESNKTDIESKLSEARTEIGGEISKLESKHDEEISGLNDTISGNKSEIESKLTTLESKVDSDISNLDTNYYDKTETDSRINAKFESIDFTPYLTKSEAAQTYLTEHQSLENYYDKTETDSRINAKFESIDLTSYLTKTEASQTYLTEHQSLENYYVKSEVDTKINDVVGSMFDSIDLTAYLTKTEAESTYIKEHQSLADYYDKTETDSRIDAKMESIDLSAYLTKSEAAETYLTEHQSLDDYYTKSYIDASISELNEKIGNIDISDRLNDYAKIWFGTYSEYAAIEPKDDKTIYIVKD